MRAAFGFVGAVFFCAVGGAGAHPAPRSAGAFPGANGRIVYLTGNRISFVSQDRSGHGQLPPVLDASRVTWSPDGRRLLISIRDIFVADATARRLRRLPIKQTKHSYQPDATWSPSGNEIVFVATTGRLGCRELFTYRLSNKRTTQLTQGCGASRPAWSPDGRAIAYDVDVNAGGPLVCIWTIRTHTRRCVARGTDPSWAPDGTRLAYSDGRNIRLLDLRTGIPTVLRATTDDPDENVSAPAWAPDGTAIAFIRYERVAKYDTHLYVMDVNGGNVRLLGGSVYDDRPDWQPVLGRTVSDTLRGDS